MTKKTSSSPRLKNAFTAFLRTQPLEQITVQSIVRKADVNRLTFYRHFLDRDDFLRTCLDT
ncbi:TetR/AcrR family transcriptional regulator, partial [Lactiplantibacillus plantarum]